MGGRVTARRRIKLPNEWSALPHQQEALDAFKAGRRRQMHIWHRRAGKDSTALNHVAVESHRTVGNYWMLYPYTNQVKRALWDGIGKNGKNFVDWAFPPAIRARTSEDEMLIELLCGSTVQLMGSDNYNALVGANPRGVIFSEWALCHPQAWAYIRPILAENNGWAWFITTPRGKNHAWKMWETVRKDPEWFCSLKTVNDTKDWAGKPLISPADIERERREGMDEATIQQEYYCSFLAAFSGSYYGTVMQRMQEQQRLTAVPYDPSLPVYAIWDIGWADHLACVFVQPKGTEDRFVGSRSWRFTTISDALNDIRNSFPWAGRIHTHAVPWDATRGSPETGNTVAEVFENLGEGCEVVARVSVHEGIELTRRLLATALIDTESRPWAPDGNNLLLVESLTGYRAEAAKQPDVFQKTPLHSWESHLSDAVRYYAVFKEMGGVQARHWGPRPDYSAADRAARVIS